MDEGWINGGFFAIEPEFLKYIKDDNTFLKESRLRNLLHENNYQLLNTKDSGNVWILKR